jgi:hypothetical protein
VRQDNGVWSWNYWDSGYLSISRGLERRDGTVGFITVLRSIETVGEMKGQAWQDAVVPLTVLYAGEVAEAGAVVLHLRREEKFRRDLEGACRDVMIGVWRVEDVRFGGREGETAAGVEMLCLHLDSE